MQNGAKTAASIHLQAARFGTGAALEYKKAPSEHQIKDAAQYLQHLDAPEETEDAEDIAEEDALMDEVNAATPVDGEDPSTDLPDNEEESGE